jgi:hypothetical protein
MSGTLTIYYPNRYPETLKGVTEFVINRRHIEYRLEGARYFTSLKFHFIQEG